MNTIVNPIQTLIKSESHSPPYMMHKFWARRPHNVFSELIAHYTEPGDIIVDPFCGGGVTVVEGLQLRRKVIGVDLNPLAIYVTKMEVTPVDIDNLNDAYTSLSHEISSKILELYKTECPYCGNDAICDWIEWKDGEPIKLGYICYSCKAKGEAAPSMQDKANVLAINNDFEQIIIKNSLWFPDDQIPDGDKTSGLIKSGITHFNELFTKRNLLALSILLSSIDKIPNEESRNFLRFIFSSSLKWASRQSHRRGSIIEGWAMHAYWIYPIELEINVWNTFRRRFIAVTRGKRFTNIKIGNYYRSAKSFDELIKNEASCLLLNMSSTSLPIEDNKVDAIITDPPYGGNVNYGELADYWNVWHRFGNRGTSDKSQEAIINVHQNKSIFDYGTLLMKVFSECYRILKPNGLAVVTFNNKDLGVVAAFIDAITRSGFSVHPEGLLYQPPINAYTTTFHAKDLGSFTGDFIFTLYKENHQINFLQTDQDLIRQKIEQLISEFLHEYELHRHTQADLRQHLYKTIIPFLADYANHNHNNYWDVVRELRKQLGLLDNIVPEIKSWCRNRYQH